MNNRILAAALCGTLIACPVSARVFDSTLKLKVYARGNGDIPDRVLGFTPARQGHRIHVPDQALWYVRPIGALDHAKLVRLAKLMQKECIPGLDISDHWEISNDSLAHLASNPTLVMLDISRTKISDAGLAHLKTCPQLAILILPIEVTDRGLANLAPLHHLREINLDQTRITDHGLAALARHTSLRDLDLSSTHISDAGVALLQKLPHLRRLVLGAAITEASAPHLAELRSLSEIDISQTQLGEKGLAALGRLPHLRSIALPRQTTDEGLRALAQSASLQVADLTRTGITDAGIKQLSKIQTLEELALAETKITNASLSSLARLPALRMLELSDTRVNSAGLAPLAQLKKLEVISLSWQKLERDDLQGMAKLKQLKAIVLNGVPLPETTMAQLKRIGTPSPWERIEGLERAALHEKPRTVNQTALSAPVPSPQAAEEVRAPIVPPKTALLPSAGQVGMAAAGTLHSLPTATPPAPAVSKGIQAPRLNASPVQETQVASIPSKPAPLSVGQVASPAVAGPTLKESGHALVAPAVVSPREAPAPPNEAAPETAAAPASVTSQKASEDNLLQVIALQSNPAHAGGFSGLSGMRQLRQTESLASLNTISNGGEASIADNEDKPENFLGEISVVPVRGTHPSNKN